VIGQRAKNKGKGRRGRAEGEEQREGVIGDFEVCEGEIESL